MQLSCTKCQAFIPPPRSTVFTAITAPVHTDPLGTCMLPQQQSMSDTRSEQQQPLLDQIIKHTDLQTCLDAYRCSPSSFCGCAPEDGVHPGRINIIITRPPPILMIHLGRFAFKENAAKGTASKLTQQVEPLQLSHNVCGTLQDQCIIWSKLVIQCHTVS